MITLVLIRHAKSDWGDPDLDDHDRPLNDRGQGDAPRMARRLAESGVRVDALLSSSALRARRTAEAFGEALDVHVTVVTDLYGAGPATLLRAASAAGAASVAVVAHDPGMTLLAGSLSGGEITHMPTCAVAVFEWDGDDWDAALASDPASFRVDTPAEAKR